MLLNALFILAASAATPPPACFDFNGVVTKPLHEPPAPGKSVSGKEPGKGIWGATRGEVHRPIGDLYKQLLDPVTIKDPARTKVKVYAQERAGYADFHLLMISVSVPMTTVNWEEEWGYAVAEGTPEAPQKVVISYQKTNGSKFLPHLCGSIVLTRKSAGDTDVFLYEEIDALGKRSPADTVKGHAGTLATLRRAG